MIIAVIAISSVLVGVVSVSVLLAVSQVVIEGSCLEGYELPDER